MTVVSSVACDSSLPAPHLRLQSDTTVTALAVPGCPEVDELHRAVPTVHDICRLDVPVRYLERVQMLKSRE